MSIYRFPRMAKVTVQPMTTTVGDPSTQLVEFLPVKTSVTVPPMGSVRAGDAQTVVMDAVR